MGGTAGDVTMSAQSRPGPSRSGAEVPMTAGTRPHPTTGRQLRRLLATAAQAVVVGGVLATTVVALLRPVVLTVPMPGAAPARPAWWCRRRPAPSAGWRPPRPSGPRPGPSIRSSTSPTTAHSSAPGFDASVVVTGRPATVTAVAACPRPWTVGSGHTSTCAAGARQVGDPAAGMSPAGAGDVAPSVPTPARHRLVRSTCAHGCRGRRRYRAASAPPPSSTWTWPTPEVGAVGGRVQAVAPDGAP